MYSTADIIDFLLVCFYLFYLFLSVFPVISVICFYQCYLFFIGLYLFLSVFIWFICFYLFLSGLSVFICFFLFLSVSICFICFYLFLSVLSVFICDRLHYNYTKRKQYITITLVVGVMATKRKQYITITLVVGVMATSAHSLPSQQTNVVAWTFTASDLSVRISVGLIIVMKIGHSWLVFHLTYSIMSDNCWFN